LWERIELSDWLQFADKWLKKGGVNFLLGKKNGFLNEVSYHLSAFS
jgi:hypothetical protein